MTMAVSKVASSNYFSQTALTSPVSVSVALAALKANPSLTVRINDSTENINRNLGLLNAYANSVTAVVQTNAATSLNVTEAEFTQYSKLLSKFTSNYQLNVTNVQASNASTLASKAQVKTLNIVDTSAKVSSQLNVLKGLNDAGKISQVVLTTPANAVTLTATQLQSSAGLIGKISGNYSLSVSGATVSQAVSYINNDRIKSVAVQDTAASISSGLDDLVDLGLRLKEVKGSDSNVFTINASQMQTDGLVIGRLYKGYQLSVVGASTDQVALLATNKKVVSVTVEDTAANLSTNMALLKKLGSSLSAVKVKDAINPLKITSLQMNNFSDVIDKITTQNFKVGISQATASQAQMLLDDARVSSVSVVDSADAVSATIDGLQTNTKITGIELSGKSSLLNLNFSQFNDNAAVIAKIKSNYAIKINGAPAASALSLATGNSRIVSVNVADTAANLNSKLSDIAKLASKLGTIVNTDSGSFSMSETEWRNLQPSLNKVQGGYSVELSQVKSSSALSLANDARIKSMSVKDTGSSLSAVMDGLNRLGPKLKAVEQSDPGTSISITASQWANQPGTIDKFLNSSFAIKLADSRQITDLAADSRVASISISDTISNVALKLDDIQAAITDLGSQGRTVPIAIRLIGPPKTVQITAGQLASDAAALACISGAYSMSVTGVSADDAATTLTNPRVASITIKDTGEAILDKLSALTSLGTKVTSLEQSDPANSMEMTQDQWASNAILLKKFQNAIHVNLSEVKAAQAKNLLADGRVEHVSVSDSADQISAKLSALHGLGSGLTAISVTDAASNAIQLSMAQFSTVGTTLDKIDGNYTLSVSNATAADAASLLNEAHVQSIAVYDRSDNISSSLAQLSANSKLTSIAQMGVAKPLELTVAQIVDFDPALSKMVGPYSLKVNGAQVSDVADLVSNSRVASMTISDSAANVQAHLGDLTSAGAKLNAIELSDSPETLTLGYSDWIANQVVLNKITNAFDVSLTNVSAAGAFVTASNSRVSQIAVKDTTENIRASLGAISTVLSKIDSIEVNDSGSTSPMDMTVDQYRSNEAALAKIVDGNYSVNVSGADVAQASDLDIDDKVVSFTVADDSDNIANHLSDLGQFTKLASITNATPDEAMSLDYTQYSSSTDVFTKIDTYSVNVSDASITHASDLDQDSHVVGFALSDTTSNINASLSTLAALSGKFTSLAVTVDDAPLEVSQSDLNDFAGANDLIDTLAKFTGDYRLSITGVSTDNLSLLLPSATYDAITLNPGATEPFTISLSKVSSIAISDTSDNISGSFDDVLALSDKLTSVTLDDSTAPIVLTADQFAASTDVLSKITNGSYHLSLTDVLAMDAVSSSAANSVDSIRVADTADNIAHYFDDMLAVVDSISAIELTDGNDLFLTQSQYDSALTSKVLSANIVISG